MSEDAQSSPDGNGETPRRYGYIVRNFGLLAVALVAICTFIIFIYLLPLRLSLPDELPSRWTGLVVIPLILFAVPALIIGGIARDFIWYVFKFQNDNPREGTGITMAIPIWLVASCGVTALFY